jgi:hypothetical protein
MPDAALRRKRQIKRRTGGFRIFLQLRVKSSANSFPISHSGSIGRGSLPEVVEMGIMPKRN